MNNEDKKSNELQLIDVRRGNLRTIRGAMRGMKIELTEPPEFPDGADVEVTVRLVNSGSRTGEGLRRCAGALADTWTDEDDRILEEIQLAHGHFSIVDRTNPTI